MRGDIGVPVTLFYYAMIEKIFQVADSKRKREVIVDQLPLIFESESIQELDNI